MPVEQELAAAPDDVVQRFLLPPDLLPVLQQVRGERQQVEQLLRPPRLRRYTVGSLSPLGA